jgi:hypothetical protein
MANEYTINVKLAGSKGGATLSTGTISAIFNQTGTHYDSLTQSVGTTNEALAFNTTDITGTVHVVVENLDSTNYVEVFRDNANAQLMSKLMPSQACLLLNVSSTALFVRSNTAACIIQTWIGQA